MLFVTHVCLPVCPALLNRMVVLLGVAGGDGGGPLLGRGQRKGNGSMGGPHMCLFSFNPHLADGKIETQKGGRIYLRSRLDHDRLLFPYCHALPYSLRSIFLENNFQENKARRDFKT